MKILIVGSSGYLGGRIYEYFKNKYDIYKFNQKKKNYKVDIVIIVAGPNSRKCELQKKKNSIERVKINKNVLKKLDLEFLKKYIYISTIHVYKKNSKINENSPLNSTNSYAKSHILAEDFLKKSVDKKKILILRLANCFGRPANKKKSLWNLVINNICLNIHKKREIKINSNENFFRNFISINYFIFILGYFFKNKKLNGIFNITSSNSISILEISNIIKKRYENLFKKKIKISHNINKENMKTNIYSKNFNKLLTKKNNYFFKKELDDLLIFTKKLSKKNA